jgi:hypothetical protein
MLFFVVVMVKILFETEFKIERVLGGTKDAR